MQRRTCTTQYLWTIYWLKDIFYKKLKKICASKCLHLYLQALTCIFMDTRRDVYQAIADPTRRKIIDLIAHDTKNLNAIAENFDMTRQAISLHIKILSECGLIVITQQGRERHCEAKLGKLAEVSAWLEQYRKEYEAKLDSLENYLNKLQSKNKRNGKQKNKR